MARVRKNTYWLTLPVLIIIVGILSLAAAPIQSRYTTVAGWQMTLSQVEDSLHCNLLTQDGQKIRLQDMTVGDTQQVRLTLTAVGDAENVTVTVESTYLTVDMELIGGIYNGETVEHILTLASNEGAMQTITTPTEASAQVTLSWDGGSMQGEFLVLLLPRETSPEDTGEAGESTDDPLNGTTETPGETTDPSLEENEENTSENGENSEESTQNQGENIEIQTNADDADGGEITGEDNTGGDITTDDTATDDTTTDDATTDDTTTDDTTTDDTPIPDEPTSPVVGDWLSGMTNFAADGVLPLWIEVPEGCEEIRLELGVGDVPVGVFPAGTRYSTDNGTSYTLLYDPYVIAVAPEDEAQRVAVLVDLSAAEISKEDLLTVTASALQGEDIVAVSTVRTLAELSLPSIQWDRNPLVVTADRSLQCVMPVYGDSKTVTVIPFNEEQTGALPSVNVEEGLLTISADGGAVKPGTYKAVLTWSWSDLEVARQEFTFYVNYTPYVTN